MAIQVNCTSCNRRFRVKDQFRGTRLPCPACKTKLLVEGPRVRGYDVFISYSSHDRQVADAACAALEGKGVRCWMAPRDIPPGASWGAAIIQGIEDSRLLLLIFSEHSNRSDQVLREVERAIAKRIPLVPLRLDATPMSKAFEYFLASCHWLDATHGALDEHLGSLTSTVRGMLLDRAAVAADAEATSPAGAAPVRMPNVGSRPTRWKLATMAAAAAVVVASLSLAMFLAGRRSGTPQAKGNAGSAPQAAPTASSTTSPAPTPAPPVPPVATIAAPSLPATVPTTMVVKPDQPAAATAPKVATTKEAPAPVPVAPPPVAEVEGSKTPYVEQAAHVDRVFKHDQPVIEVLLDAERDLLITATNAARRRAVGAAGGGDTASESARKGGKSVVRQFTVTTGEGAGDFGPALSEDEGWPVQGMAFSPDGLRLAVTRSAPNDDGGASLAIWEVERRRFVRQFKLTGRGGWERPWFSTGGDTVIVPRNSGTVHEFNAFTGETLDEVRVLRAERARQWRCTALSPDRTRLYIGMSLSSIIEERSLPDGQIVKRFTRKDGAGGDLITLSVDGKSIAALCDDGRVRIWGVHTRQERASFKPKGTITAVAFIGAAGQRFLTGEEDGTIMLWDIPTKSEIHRFRGHAAAVLCLSPSPDQFVFASGSDDATARTWRLPNK